jgi:2-C-methyl-D-erythritol 4-phosphate cytidylyltransferase
MLTQFLEQTRDDRVAALVSPASDTYKVVRAGRVETTLDRASLWELQGLLRFDRQSLDRVYASGDTGHELEAARLAGIPIRLVQADPMNFAVRSPDDCRLAELVLSQ